MPLDLGKKSILSYEVPTTVTQGVYRLKEEYEDLKRREEKKNASRNRDAYLKYILIPSILAGSGYLVAKDVMKSAEFAGEAANRGATKKAAITGAAIRNILLGAGGLAAGIGGGVYLGTKNLSDAADKASRNMGSVLGKNVLLGGLGIGSAIGIPILSSALKDKARKNREKKKKKEEAAMSTAEMDKSSAYVRGFMNKCAEYGVDGCELLKKAQFAFVYPIMRYPVRDQMVKDLKMRGINPKSEEGLKLAIIEALQKNHQFTSDLFRYKYNKKYGKKKNEIIDKVDLSAVKGDDLEPAFSYVPYGSKETLLHPKYTQKAPGRA